MLTRELFLAGVKFHLKGRNKVQYQFVATRNDTSGSHPGYIREIGLMPQPAHHCDVLSTGDDELNTYVFMLGEMFNHTYTFSQFEVTAENKVS